VPTRAPEGEGERRSPETGKKSCRELTRSKKLKMRTSQSWDPDVGVVSEDDFEEEDPSLKRNKRGYRSRNWLKRVAWLTRTGRNGTKQPPVGRICLILKGDMNKDLGRMGVVSRQTKSMVSIVWKDEDTGRTHEKLKQPESLIQLEEGLKVEQDTDGMLWIVRIRGDEMDLHGEQSHSGKAG
jgi:hypothetical protein